MFLGCTLAYIHFFGVPSIVQWNLYITATQGTGQNWPLYTGGRYIQVIVLIPKRYQRSEMNIKFLEIHYLI